MKAAQKALIAALAAGIVLLAVLAVLAGPLLLLRRHTVRESATVHDQMAEVVSAHQEALAAMMGRMTSARRSGCLPMKGWR